MKFLPSDAANPNLVELRPGSRAPALDRPTFTSRLLIPVAWERLTDMPSRGMLDAIERSDSAIFDTLLMGVDLDAARVEDEVLADALKPIRLKLDMIFEMLGAISYRDVPLPEPRDIELGLIRAAWTAPETFERGEWLLLKLYFHKTFREPVVLAGRVVGSEALADRREHRVEVELLEMSEGVSESFARLVFLEHRRHLAQHPDQIAVSRRRM
jgi:hypothetical protein